MKSNRSPAGSQGKPLARYVAMRDFEKTPEPSGVKPRKAAATKLKYVIQMHRATRLHYDFRLEANGVLMSWAVPKGPSRDPGEKRLAMHVEDHPYDYREFEGIIPAGNYGAGEVILWDRGWYAPLETDDPFAAVAKGKLKFILHGKKLHGEFTLVRIKNREESGDPWLLIKDHDQYVDAEWKVEDEPRSVRSGKTVRDIANDPRAPHWISRPVERGRAPARAAGATHSPHRASDAGELSRRAVRQSEVVVRNQVGRLSCHRGNRPRRQSDADIAQR